MKLQLSRRVAILVLAILLTLLLFGTLMPGAWRDEAVRAAHMPGLITKVAHFVVFACIACVARLPSLNMSLLWVGVAALALALLTEGLQFLAVNRDPSWRDVGIDLTGAALGVAIAQRRLSATVAD